MENLVDYIIKLTINEIEDYEFPLDKPFGLEINYKNVKYCLIIRFSSENKNLICCGPGAHARDERTSKGILKTPPFFHRWSWYKYFEESFIAYADPIFFYDDIIRLGWFVGDKEQWYLETLSIIIKKLSINQGILHENILFYGSSGGGFTSVGLGTLIKKSKVLINNSQLNVMNYHETHVNNLFRILYKEFPNLSKKEIINLIDYRLNTIKLFNREKYVPPITYYVNVLSHHDIYNHCIPFIKEICDLEYFENNFQINLYKEIKKRPHSSLSTKESIKIVKTFCKQHLYNNKYNYNSFNNLIEENILLKNKNEYLVEENKLLNQRLYNYGKYVYFKSNFDTGSTKLNLILPVNYSLKFQLNKTKSKNCRGYIQIGTNWNNSIFIGQISDEVFGIWLRKNGKTIMKNSEIQLNKDNIIEYTYYDNIHIFKVNNEILYSNETTEYHYNKILNIVEDENIFLTNLKIYEKYE